MELQTDPFSSPKLTYRECHKNHAFSLGGYIVEGCRDFLPAGADGTLEALHCAAWNCHCNFHRKESSPIHEALAIAYRTPTDHYHVQHPTTAGSVEAGGNLNLRDEMEHEDVGNYGMLMGNGNGKKNVNGNRNGGSSLATKKRFRTKFTAEHKERMLALAEKIVWKIQRHDEEDVHLLCKETGILRNVFKIWMHNNKHTIYRKP